MTPGLLPPECRPVLVNWLVALAFALVFGLGFFSCLDCVGHGDWDYFVSQSLVAYRTIFEFGELPLWNPFVCGGMPLAGNFQSRVFSPSLLLVLGLGPVLGNRVWAILLLALGFEGGRRLAVALGAGPQGSRFCALAIAGNGGIVLHLSAGQLGIATFTLLPWLLMGIRTAWEFPRRGVLLAAPWGALMFVEAGLYPLVYGFLLAAIWALSACLSQRSLRPAYTTLATAAAIPLLSAATFVPAAAFMLENTRASVPPESISVVALYDIFLSPAQTIDGRVRFPGQAFWWHEYGTYVGPVFLLIVVLGACILRRRALGWLLLGGFFLLLGLGDFSALGPWSLLHHLPVFASMRDPGRALLPAVMCLALGVAPVLDRLRRAAPVLVGLFAVSLGVVLIRVPFDMFRHPVDLSTSRAAFTQRTNPIHAQTMSRENYTTISAAIAKNQGTLRCYEPVGPKVFASERWPHRPEAELFFSPQRAQGVEPSEWSPNHVRIDVTGLSEPAILVINQNFAEGWGSEDGREVRPFHGLIAAPVVPGDQTIGFAYRPIHVYAAIVANLLFLLLWVRLYRTTPKSLPALKDGLRTSPGSSLRPCPKNAASP